MSRAREAIQGTPDGGVTGASADGEVAAGSTATVTVEMPHDGAFKRLFARCVQGQEFDVEYRAALRREEGSTVNLVAESSADSLDYLAGEGITFGWEIRQTFHQGDELVFEYNNNDQNNPHHVLMLMVADYGLGPGGGPVDRSAIDELDDALGSIL